MYSGNHNTFVYKYSVHNIFKRSTAVVGELKQALSVNLNRKYLSRLVCI